VLARACAGAVASFERAATEFMDGIQMCYLNQILRNLAIALLQVCLLFGDADLFPVE
jgi:hypothetical protein